MFNDIFPVVLGVFCPCVTFGVLERMNGCCSKSRFRITEEGIADETTAKGVLILEREKESVRNGGRPGETHSAFTLRREPKKRTAGMELNRMLFGRPKPASEVAGGDETGALLANEAPIAQAGPSLTRAEELKARLASRAEAARSRAGVGDVAVRTLLPSAPTNPPSSSTNRPLPKTSLDDLFANL